MTGSRLALLACFVLVAWAKEDYTGYRLLSSTAKTAEEVELLKGLEGRVDFWTPPYLNRACDILVSPEAYEYVLSFLHGQGIDTHVSNDNIQKSIDHEKAQNEREIKRRIVSQSGNTDVMDVVGIWARHNQISAWLDSMATQYKNLASVKTIGKTYEGRDIKVMKISTGGSAKPSIFIDCAIHAREWLSPASCTWMIREFLSTHSSSPRTKAMLEKFDWLWLPVANPDGYEYSHTNTRMWRKTRTPNDFRDFLGRRCYGADPNRNWDSFWSSGIGTSANGCSDTYKGKSPFSEPNTQAMSRFLAQEKVLVYVSIHAYSQLWMTPWSYTTSPRPDDAAEIDRVAAIAVDALFKVHGTKYEIGTPGQLLYDCSGSSVDWAKQAAGAKYAYALEVRPDFNCLIDPNCNGFISTLDQIVPSGQELFASFLAMAEAIPA